MKLVLFDVDGTLLSSGGAGTVSLNLAFRDLFTIYDAFRDINMAGKTDIQIIKEGLLKHRIGPDSSRVLMVIDSYLENLRRELKKSDRKHLNLGVKEVLTALIENRIGTYMGLLTGNVEEGARIKLDTFNLNSYFPFGAFGNDDEDRNKLLPVAVRRFEMIYQVGIDYSDCIVVGDTPRDVYCAKLYGASCIAVATGSYDANALVRAGADIVFEDLSDECAFLNAVG
ncbi:MAG: HAD family hydrolase [Dissulfurispiraceae bacterium]